MHVYNLFTLLDSRNYYNIVNQLHANKNSSKKKEAVKKQTKQSKN